MPALAVVFWIANILLDTMGRVAFKVAAGHPGDGPAWRRMLGLPSLWLGILCFCFEFVAWLALLSLIPLSMAVLIGSINIATVALAGRIFFGERLSSMRLTGVVLVAAGVALAGGSM